MTLRLKPGDAKKLLKASQFKANPVLAVLLSKVKPKKREDLGDLFEFYLKAEPGMVTPGTWQPWKREYMPLKATNGREWRVDVAFPDHKLAIECQGGIWSRGAHGHPADILRNMEKQNDLTLHGWRFLQFDRKMITDGTAVRQTLEALLWRP